MSFTCMDGRFALHDGQIDDRLVRAMVLPRS